MILRRNYKYRIYPTKQQERLLLRWGSVLRTLWNLCQEQRLTGYARSKDERVFPSHYSQSKEMTQLLEICPWMNEVQCQARQEVIADLDKAWSRCFKKIARAPRWKRKTDDMRIYAPSTVPAEVRNGFLSFGGIRYAPLGALKIVLDRPTEGTVKSWSIKRSIDEWYAKASLEIEVSDPIPVNTETVGIDRGIALFIADSDGRTVHNIRARGQLEKRIARAQRSVSRKKRGSSNKAKAAAKVADLLRLAARRREVHVHTQSLYYAEHYGTVVIEKLNLKNMTASASGTVDEPGTNVSQKAGLNREMLDTGAGRFAETLKYKVAERGGRVLEVSAVCTSQTCPRPSCGHVSEDNRVRQDKFCCVKCGYAENADISAARVIKQRGLKLGIVESKKIVKTFSRGRNPAKTAVKPTVVQPVEDSRSKGAVEAGTKIREDVHHTHSRIDNRESQRRPARMGRAGNTHKRHSKLILQ